MYCHDWGWILQSKGRLDSCWGAADAGCFLTTCVFGDPQVRMEALICRNLDAALRNEPKPYMFDATAG
jgi:hypothetical protein